MRLASVLNDPQIVAFSKFQYGIHVRRLPIEVDRKYGGDSSSRSTANEPPSSAIDFTLVVKMFLELRDIHVKGALIDVDKLWLCSSLENGLNGGGKRVRNSNDHISHADTSSQ